MSELLDHRGFGHIGFDSRWPDSKNQPSLIRGQSPRRWLKPISVPLDKNQRTEKYSSADFVAHARIPVWIDAEHAIAHNKLILADCEIVITGSFNFTKAAEERNAENLLVICDKPIAETYEGK